MSRRRGISVVIGMPEEATAIRGPITVGSIDVDIHDVPRQRVTQVEPRSIY